MPANEDRTSSLCQKSHRTSERIADDRIGISHDLIGEKARGISCKCKRHLDSLHFPARQLMHSAIEKPRNLEKLERFITDPRTESTLDLSKVMPHAERPRQVVGLTEIEETAACHIASPRPLKSLSVYLDPAAFGTDYPCADLEKGRLAGSHSPKDADDLSC